MAELTARAQLAEMVPVDGAELATQVVLPESAPPYPASLFRTPYGRENMFPDPSSLPGAGIALVNQDVRGRFGSTGAFQMGATDVVDGGAAVDWITRQSWSDGRVAGRGLSYPALMQWFAALAQPEGLVCIAPMMAPAFWRGMSLREGGAFQLALAAHWLPRQAAEAATTPEALRGDLYAAALEFEQVVTQLQDGSGRWETSVERCLEHRALSSFPLADPGRFLGTEPFTSTWRRAFSEPDAHNWFTGAGPAAASTVTVPTLVMGGWYDVWSHEATLAYQHIRRTSPAAIAASHRLVMAPYGHGTGWAGELPRPADAERFNCDLDIRWSEEWFFDRRRDLRDLPPVTYYCYNAGWRDADAWPPAGTRIQRWNLDAENGVLTLGEVSREAFRSYAYDPANPVPSRGGRSLGLPAGPCRQDGLTGGARADVLSFDSAPLERPLTITGEVAARLGVTSTVPQTDFTAKLVDVFPDGRAFSICDGICRTRFRDGSIGAPDLHPSRPSEVAVHLGSIAYRLESGHRLRLDVSSSNFPWFDINLNADGPDGSAPWSERRVATQTVWSGPASQSFIDIAVSGDPT